MVLLIFDVIIVLLIFVRRMKNGFIDIWYGNGFMFDWVMILYILIDNEYLIEALWIVLYWYVRSIEDGFVNILPDNGFVIFCSNYYEQFCNFLLQNCVIKSKNNTLFIFKSVKDYKCIFSALKISNHILSILWGKYKKNSIVFIKLAETRNHGGVPPRGLGRARIKPLIVKN